MRREPSDGPGASPPPTRRAIVLGAVLVFFRFPRKEEEQRMFAAYHAMDLA